MVLLLDVTPGGKVPSYSVTTFCLIPLNTVGKPPFLPDVLPAFLTQRTHHPTEGRELILVLCLVPDFELIYGFNIIYA